VPQRALFYDWHQTLCHEPFWRAELDDPTHSLHETAQLAVQRCFVEQPSERIEAWMRGEIATEAVLRERFEATIAERLRGALVAGVRAMAPTPTLWTAVTGLEPAVATVLATDNVDLFGQHAAENPFLRGRAVLCSAELGVTKAEDPLAFFGETLTALGLGFADACLLDDRADNCAAFQACGGQAIQHRSETESVTALQTWARQ
jgi:FMN phosphatase YigB (HAD superfamily)